MEKDHSILDKNKLRIAVVMGGASSEKEVSISSGSAVAEGLKKQGWHVKPLVLARDAILREDLRHIDCVFIALHGGFGENGELQARLTEWNIPYTGSGPEACRATMNKRITKEILTRAGLPTPQSWIFYKRFPLPITMDEQLPLPLAVKPLSEGSSIGLTCVKHHGQLKSALEKAWEYGDEALVEEWITGDELTLGVLGEEPLPLVQILPAEEFYNYKAKYDSQLTRYFAPAPLSPEDASHVQKIGLKAFHVLSCYGFARIDLILSKDKKPYILEINAVPGFTASSLFPKAARAAQIEFPELCERLVRYAFLREQNQPVSLV